MNSKILFLIVSLFIIDNSSLKEQLIKEAETYLKSTLIDQNSYERVTFLISDTVTLLKFIKRTDSINLAGLDFMLGLSKSELECAQSMKDKYKILGTLKENDLRIKKITSDIDSMNKAKEVFSQRDDSINKITIDNSPIKLINFITTYRAKNHFGVTIKTENKLYKDVESKTWMVY